MDTIKLAIIEDNVKIREYLIEYFTSCEEFKIVSTAGSVEEFLKHIRKNNSPEIILLDVGLPGINGIEGIPKILKVLPSTKIVMQTVHTDSERVFQALKNGAIGYFQKNEPFEKMKSGLLSIQNGGSPMSAVVARRLVEYFNPNVIDSKSDLTKTEKLVVNGIVDGLSYKMIGAQMGISLDTVRVHIRHIYKKLHVNSKTEVISKSFRGEI